MMIVILRASLLLLQKRQIYQTPFLKVMIWKVCLSKTIFLVRVKNIKSDLNLTTQLNKGFKEKQKVTEDG